MFKKECVVLKVLGLLGICVSKKCLLICFGVL